MQSIDFYEENADKLLHEQLVLEYHSLVKKIALHIKRRLPSYIELEDLLQSGFVGLIEARKAYQENMGASFETFASIRIQGAIIDALRKNSWGTREATKNMRIIGEAISVIEQREKKTPSSSEIAAELGVTLDEYTKMCQQASVCHMMNIDFLENDQALLNSPEENPDKIAETEQNIYQIKKTLNDLPQREQYVLSLYYVEEFTLKQIAEILDLTEARVCQLHSQAIARIRHKLNNAIMES